MARSTTPRQNTPTVKIYPYSYEDCKNQRDNFRLSWRALGKRYDRHHESVRERYKRDTLKIENQKIRERNHGHKKDPANSKRKQKKGTGRAARLGKYNPHNNPPTGYISPLDNHDWLVKYDITFTWDRTKERDEVIDHIWSKWGLVVVHRGFGKSKIEWGLVARYILEERGSWLELTDGKRQAKKIYKKVKGLLHRREIRNDYGDIIEQFDGSELSMELVDEIHGGEDDPVLQVATRGGSIIGMHPRVIGIHDFLQRKFKSDESEEDLRDWWDEVASYLSTHEVGKETRITGVITRKGPDDLYSYMFSKGLKQFHRLAIEKLSGRWAESLDDFIIDDNGLCTGMAKNIGEFKTLNCPNWPTHALLYERFINYHAFEQQMQGRIVAKEGNYFHLADWEASITDTPLIDYGSSAMEEFTDPGWGESSQASDSALLVATWYRGEMHIIQLKAGKFGTIQQEKEAIKLHQEYECISIHLEDNFAQMTRAYDRESDIWKLRGVRLFYQKNLPGGTGNNGKADRINWLQKPYRMQRIKLHHLCNQQDDFKKQFLSYRGLVKPGASWDILDVVATAYQYLSKKHGTPREQKINQEITHRRF